MEMVSFPTAFGRGVSFYAGDAQMKPYTYGDKVAVYYNLRRKCLSVCDARRGRPRRLLGHTDKINLSMVDFKVSQAGQARVRNQKRKNVHAFVIGIVGRTLPEPRHGFEPLTYNPYTHKGFTDNQGYIRNYADYAKVVGNKVFVPVNRPYN